MTMATPVYDLGEACCLARASLGTCWLTVVGLGWDRVGGSGNVLNDRVGSANVFAGEGGCENVLCYEMVLWDQVRLPYQVYLPSTSIYHK